MTKLLWNSSFVAACEVCLRMQNTEVAELIEWLLVQVEMAAAESKLREEPDYAFIDDLVLRTYRTVVQSV